MRVSMISAVLAVRTAIALAAEPGVTDDAVVLGSHQPLSGPAATAAMLSRASEAYFRMVNERGGVHGRRIVYRYEDDGYSPPRAVEVVRKLVERDEVFALFNGVGTPVHAAVYRYLLDKRIPDMYVGSGGSRFAFPPENGFKPYPTLFVGAVPHQMEGSILGAFAADRWPGKRIALFYQNDDLGRDGAAGFKRAIQGKLGIVSDDVYETSTVSVDSQILNARARGADIVLIYGIAKFAGMYLKRSFELGWRPTFLLTGIVNYGATWKLAGPDCDPENGKTQCGASDGVITSKWGPTPEERDNPKVVQHHHLMRTYGRGLKVDGTTLYGQAVAELMVETLRQAGRDLTRQSLVRAAESIKNWSGGLFPEITMSSDDHVPFETLKVVAVGNGRNARDLTGWIAGPRPTP